MTKISIITVNYNDLAGLKKTVESVRNQDYENIDHVIIDGGSSDGSAKFIERNSEFFSYWISESDKGIYHAMNKGIVNSKGSYMLFLNSGDYLVANNVISTLVNHSHDEDIVFGNVIRVGENGVKFSYKSLGRSEATLSYMIHDTINHPASLIKRTLFDKTGLYDEGYKIVSDWIFFFRSTILYKATVKYVDIDVTYFFLDGISSQSPELVEDERELALSKMVSIGVLEDYKNIRRLKELRPQVREYNIIKSNKLLWLLIRVYFKLFRIKL